MKKLSTVIVFVLVTACTSEVEDDTDRLGSVEQEITLSEVPIADTFVYPLTISPGEYYGLLSSLLEETTYRLTQGFDTSAVEGWCFDGATERNLSQSACTAAGYSWMYGHDGIDFAGGERCGAPIYAAANGRVISADYVPGFGNHVLIMHVSSRGITYSSYSHLQERSFLVRAGDTVRLGQQIGRMGSTGASSGCHLHFMITTSASISSGYYSSRGIPDWILDPIGFIENQTEPPHVYSGYTVLCESVEAPTEPDWDAVGHGCVPADAGFHISQDESITLLTRIDDVRLSHRFFIRTFRDEAFAWEWMADENIVGYEGWEDAYFWSEIREPEVGDWRVEVYIIYRCEDDGVTCYGSLIDEARFVSVDVAACEQKSTGTDCLPDDPDPDPVPIDPPDCETDDPCLRPITVDGECRFVSLSGCCTSHSECRTDEQCLSHTCLPFPCETEHVCEMAYRQDHQCIVESITNCCSTDLDCNVGEYCSDAHVCEDIVSECVQDTECEDDEYCDGVSCRSVSCVPRDACDNSVVENHRCRHRESDGCCLTADDCDAGERCTADHVCIIDTRCEDNSDCADDEECVGSSCAPVECGIFPCIETSVVNHACVFDLIPGCCSSDSSCSEGQICQSQVCVDPP